MRDRERIQRIVYEDPRERVIIGITDRGGFREVRLPTVRKDYKDVSETNRHFR